MAGQDNETKKRIAKVALTLFAMHGYHAVSIRDIGRQAGVKGSTIYYYFKSKDDIFQSLLASIRTIMQAKMMLFQDQFDRARWIDKDPFIAVAVNFMDNFLLHDDVYPFIQMLLIERHSNASADKLFRELMFSAPEEQNKAIFMQMAQRGFFHAVDPAQLAFEYHAIIIYVFFKYFGAGQRSVADHEKARRDLINLVGSFYRRYLQRV